MKSLLPFFVGVLVSGVVGLARPCAGQLSGVESSSGTVEPRTGFISGSLTMEPGLMRMGPPITGAPYSGEMETERIQTSNDGTHINQKRELSRLYRDSQGRTRTERLLSPPWQSSAKEEQPRLVQIYDPVAGYNYTLDPRKLIAVRMVVETLGARPENPPKSLQTGNADPKPPSSGLPSAGPISLRKNNMQRESLGTQTIDGIEAEGWRTTITIPAGAMGNDKPITHVCETWPATELKVLVLSKCSDPRSGASCA